MLTRGLAAECDRELFTARHQHALSKLAIDRIKEEDLSEVLENAQEALDELMALYRPWAADERTKEEKEKDEYRGLSQSWEKTFGSLDDPEVAARVEELRSGLLRRQTEAAPTDPVLQAAGVFNRETAAHLSNLQILNKQGVG